MWDSREISGCGDRGRGSQGVDTEDMSVHRTLLKVHKSAEPQWGAPRRRLSSFKDDNTSQLLCAWFLWQISQKVLLLKHHPTDTHTHTHRGNIFISQTLHIGLIIARHCSYRLENATSILPHQPSKADDIIIINLRMRKLRHGEAQALRSGTAGIQKWWKGHPD